MKTLKTLLTATVCLLVCSTVWADVPQMISYQGILLDDNGDPFEGTINVTFRIYDSPSDGNEKWQETQSVTSSEEGLFNILLGGGDGTPITDEVFDDPVRWLEIQAQGDQPMVPRIRMVSVPFAHRVSTIDGASGGIISGNVSIQSDLDVDGNTHVSGKATIGPGHTNTGTDAFVAGAHNTVDGEYATVAGGRYNEASGMLSVVSGGGHLEDWLNGNKATADYSSIGGGENNTASGSFSSVGGGDHNMASGIASTIGGGTQNLAEGMYSTIPGGYGNRITSSGEWSYLFGIGSNLTEDSTFMVDMPHIHFGDESTGYEFPAEDGSAGQVMATDGNGQLDWTDVSGEGTGIVPLGALLPWVRSILGNPPVPDGFAVCDGSVIDDPESPLEGEYLPDLIGRFLRGNSSSGGTGGSENHQHQFYDRVVTAGTGVDDVVGWTLGYTQPASTLPPYFDVVWIMRIR